MLPGAASFPCIGSTRRDILEAKECSRTLFVGGGGGERVKSTDLGRPLSGKGGFESSFRGKVEAIRKRGREKERKKSGGEGGREAGPR